MPVNTVGFQRVPETKDGQEPASPRPDRREFDAATAEVESLGRRWLEPRDSHELEGFRWRCMADPEGNEFDSTSGQRSEVSPGVVGAQVL
jgi:hypothetical protein